MNKEECIEFVKDWIHRIWELQEQEHLSRFYSTDVEGYFNGELVSFDILKSRVGAFYNHLKKVRIEVNQLIVEKNKFALRAQQRYEFKEGKIVVVPSMIFVHLKEGKISKYWLKTRSPFDFHRHPSLEGNAEKQ